MSTAPSLISEDIEQTNTLALLLPHLALFEGPQLRLLKEHYSQFGNIVHWAPVKGFGRVIIVYATDEEAALAKKEGDRLFLDVDLGEDVGRKRGHQRSASQPAHGYVSSSSFLFDLYSGTIVSWRYWSNEHGIDGTGKSPELLGYTA
jgi:hypothetical protein